MPKMKIEILVQAFPPFTVGGIEIATYNLAEQLTKKGHNVNVITRRDKGTSKIRQENNFCIYRVNFPKIPIIGIIFYCIQSLFIIMKDKPDVILAQAISTGMAAFLPKIFCHIPYVVWGRGQEVYSSWILKNFISKLVLKNADIVIALTENMKEKIKKIYNRNDMIVIPNSIDLVKYSNLDKRKCRQELDISQEVKIITFVGNLRIIKGVKYLIQSIEIVIKRESNIKLFIIGEGAERKNLENLVDNLKLNNYINFLGKVSNEKIPVYMHVSDIFVLPSLGEGFPGVVLEAMAAGLPIIATNIPGMKEIMQDKINGFIVPSQNGEEIANKILLLLERGDLRNKISKNNLEKIKLYSWETTTQKIEDIFSKIIKPFQI